MKAEYIRNMQASYMRLMSETELSKTEEEMLSHNQIEGILKMSWQKEDEKYLLRYDITGKQALDVLLESTMADEELLLKLILGVCQTCKRLERYLLSQDAILLSPEMIYWDNKKEVLYFCYYPDCSKTLQEQFVHLMEYMLIKTNHKSVRAVEVAYGVYEELLQENYSLGMVQKRVEELRESWYREMQEKDKEVIEHKKISVEKNVGVENKNWKKLLKLRLEEVKAKMVSWIKPEEKKSIKRKTQIEEFSFSPEEEEPEERGLPTVLLAEKKTILDGILKYEGKDGLPDLHISKVPFLIGSANNCDGIIADATISRQHARITQVDDVFFIEDLNSSNGTRAAGEILNYKTRVSIKRDDVIYFANQPYRFL